MGKKPPESVEVVIFPGVMSAGQQRATNPSQRLGRELGSAEWVLQHEGPAHHVMGDQHLKWTLNSRSEQIRIPKDPMRMEPWPNLTIGNVTRDKSKVLFLLPKPHFVSTGQGTQKAKAWVEDKTKQMSGSQLTKMSSVNPKCDGRLRIQLPW